MVTIREAKANDAKAILEFCYQIGSETDNLSYGSEGIGLSVADEESILAEIQNADTSFFLLAEINN